MNHAEYFQWYHGEDEMLGTTTLQQINEIRIVKVTGRCFSLKYLMDNGPVNSLETFFFSVMAATQTFVFKTAPDLKRQCRSTVPPQRILTDFTASAK